MEPEAVNESPTASPHRLAYQPVGVIQPQHQHLADSIGRLRAAAKALAAQLGEHPAVLSSVKLVAGEEYEALLREAGRP